MDQVHGVDVSWLHTPNKENQQRKHASSTASTTKESRPPASTNGDLPAQTNHNHTSSDPSKKQAPSHVTPPSLSQPKQNSEPAVPSTPTPPASTPPSKNQPSKRPNLLGRGSADKSSNEEPRASRRPSWINNISSRFSSSQSAPSPQQTPPKSPPAPTSNATAGAQKGSEEAESVEPYIPSKPKDSGSFFSSLTRKLSSASQGSGIPKVQGNGGVCPRKVLNVDPNRERCLVPELDQSKLRRVSFCVDVEIAGGPKYTEDAPEDDAQQKRKKKDVKLKERAEGEALKHPNVITEEKDELGEPALEATSKAVPVPGHENNANGEAAGTLAPQEDAAGSPTVGSLDDGTQGMTRKKEKKKRSEIERKERKEKKLRRAQENGSIPVEMTAQDDDDDSEKGSLAGSLPNGAASGSPKRPAPMPTKQDRPTTDPVRIYRRCCQLRETPILKRITEQLMSPKCSVVNEPGVVGCLDLTGSRLQLADVVTLGDWLAVVPVKRLILEDADLNDEGVRVVLAGLLAAKRPEPTRRKNNGPRHRDRQVPPPSRQERSGVVEKISLKNNPRMTRLGWKHISLFLYMCRSIKAVDLSMNQFPETMPPSAQLAAKKNPEKSPPPTSQELNAAETLYKCLSERLGGSHLEELSVSECDLTVEHVRKIIDGAMMCGISRLGLAGNHLSDESLEHVIHYIRSGVCHGLDLGGNDLRGKLGLIADTFNDKPDTPCWGLSLADCNLDTASVKPLFPALVKLPNFRFIDLSHNRDLCGEDNGTISLLRRYIPQMQELKRIHLSDVGMSTKQAIALAEVLPEGPRLAHLSILENPQLKALSNATDEASQEEACALYASLMTAVRVSKTLICIDIDVPSSESNEIVKALAKQVVAYSLRNMEHFAIAEATGDADATANAAASLTAPHGGEEHIKGVVVPDVLMHLVGHVDGSVQNADDDDPAPDDDYIVGGTGVVKALQYVLGEKANDMRKTSRPSTPISGRLTPSGERASSSAGLDQEGNAKAKQMSKDLLNSARKIRTRLQPALIKEATAGDEMAYRRLLFLDQTLLSMIQRFEEEYPDTRVAPSSTTPEEPAASLASSFEASSHNPAERAELLNPPGDVDEADDELKPPMSRHNSDASLASRALTLEEGRLHRLGQHLRREVVDLTPASPGTPPVNGGGDSPAIPPTTESHQQRLDVLKERLESTPGDELGPLVEKIGWKAVLEKVGANLEDLRALQEQDPEGWEQFRDSQLKARMNV
ncbi:hypothetical protein Q7P37_004260 [Cladosporium fusiforme]